MKQRKLSIDQAIQIRQRIASGEFTGDIADDLGVDYHQVTDCAYGRTYKYLNEDYPPVNGLTHRGRHRNPKISEHTRRAIYRFYQTYYPGDEEYLTNQQAANLLGVSPAYIQQIRSGQYND